MARSVVALGGFIALQMVGICYNNVMLEKILEKWIDFAAADLDVAKRLFKSPKPTSWTYLLALWHCHQCIEKMLKMLAIKQGKELLKIHDLSRLVELANITFTSEMKQFINQLNKFYIRSRYPDLIYSPLPKTEKKFVEEFIKKTNQFFIWLKKQ
ncbi:MAG: HEPN domain-containing protein [bacterium]|nr:HEPN domain-containing protein [bacterium]